jgi:hypothetical protein
VRLFEQIAPYKRLAACTAGARSSSRATTRSSARTARRPARATRDAPRADVIEALDVTLSFEAWDRLRTDQRLGRERASAALERTVFALLSEVRS